uniref:Uncharacterized protein n=1 Tax=Parascaris equorum TaxID=6256 RepID=A0A914SAD9_PAREQ
MKLPHSVIVFIFSIVVKLDGEKYTRRKDLLFQKLINSTNFGSSDPTVDERTSNDTFGTIENHPICRWIGFLVSTTLLEKM